MANDGQGHQGICEIMPKLSNRAEATAKSRTGVCTTSYKSICRAFPTVGDRSHRNPPSYHNRWILTAVDYATGWPIAKALPAATEDAIAEFIFHEIYMHYGAPQEIFTDGGKNLWSGVVQAYLAKIKTIHKGTSPYHSRTNGKVESLNGLLGGILTKLLLGKSTKLWDLYLDKAIFAYHIWIHTTMKTTTTSSRRDQCRYRTSQ